jgi:hypothetical protein
MGDGGNRNWMGVLFGGIGVAAFTFAAPIVWQNVSHRDAGPDHVVASLRVEDGTLFLLVRNNSNEPLDLVEAEIEIDGVGNPAEEFGAYPAPSHVYEVNAKSTAQLTQRDGRLSVKLRIAQAIDPGQVDQFGFRINGPAGSLTPAIGSLSGKVMDVRGNVYPVNY